MDQLPTSTLGVKGATIRVWLALSEAQQREGLMFVEPHEIADDQGMLFVFPNEAQRGFWMLNTVTPLDIAYARFDGTIVSTWQMPPLTLRTFPSIEPAMFALEMKQGSFDRIGLREGDRLDLPTDLFNSSR